MEDLVPARQLLQFGDRGLLFMAIDANRLEVNRSMAVPLTLLRQRSVGWHLARRLSVECPILEMLNCERRLAASERDMVDFAADPESTAATILLLMKSGNDVDLKSAVLKLWYLKRQVPCTEYADLPARTMEQMLKLADNPSRLLQLLSEVNSGDDGMF